MKRLVSLLLCLALAAALIPGVTAQAATSDFSTVEEVLYEMELFSPSSGDSLDSPVSRAVLAKVAVSISPQRVAVPAKSTTSPFKDVKFNHWAAPYIKLAASAGYMSAYSDGTFKPDENVKLEDGVTAILKALGYTTSDFGTDYPYGPMSFAAGKDYDLLNGISSGTGSVLTRRTLMRLVYNALDCNIKSLDAMSSTTLLADLGYTRVKSDSPIDMDSIDPDELTGPVTIKSGVNWVSKLEITTSDYTVYRNDATSSRDNIASYDVLYYSKRQNALYAYSRSVTGILQEVSPSRQSPETVTVGGVTYTLEGDLAKDAVNLSGEIRTGDIVMLLFGMDNLVADIVARTETEATQYGFVMESGRKAFNLETGGTVQSYYVSVATIDGNIVEYRLKNDADDYANKFVRITFSDGQAVIGSTESVTALRGTINADARTVGTMKFAPGVKIMEVESGTARNIPLSRLDGVDANYLRNKFYTTNSKGEIESLFIRASTGDTLSYGLVTYAEVNQSDSSLSSTVSYNIAGEKGSFIISGKGVNYPTGPSAFHTDETGMFSEASALDRLANVNLELTQIRTANGAAFPLSDNVVIYTHIDNKYQVISLDQARQLGSGYSLNAYYDKPAEQCGRIRIIIAEKN